MDVLDQALARLHAHAPEYGPLGFSNHGPMVVEALVALGREDAVLPWVERYARRLGPAPAARAPIDAARWREGLGDLTRFADWRALFESELAREDHGCVLRRWVPRLSPGVAAAAFHGVLRTAHATRAIDRAVTPTRCAELAQGLAYWAACHLELGGSDAPRDARLPSQAIAEVARVDLGPARGSITDRLVAFAAGGRGAALLSLSAPGDDLPAYVADLARTMAAVYAANVARGTGADIAFVHGVTGTSALRLLLPHLSHDAGARLLCHGFQAAAALHAAYGHAEVAAVPVAPIADLAGAVDRAIASGDEHAIKWIEACDREQGATGRGLGAIATLAVERLT